MPTCERPALLGKLLHSISFLVIPPNTNTSLVVVDNDIEQSARQTVEAFAQQSSLSVHYTVAPERGLSNVRNRIFDYAVEHDADYVVSVDDDNTVSSGWLAEIYSALMDERADACSGRAMDLIDGTPANGPKQKDTDQKIRTVAWMSTSNFIISSGIYKDMKLRFNPEYNFLGSEDEEFFRRATKAGAKLIRNRKAYVYHTLTKNKQTLKYFIIVHYCRYTVRTHFRLMDKTHSAGAILLTGIASLIAGLVLLPFSPFHRYIRHTALRQCIKPFAYIRGIFGISTMKPYMRIAKE